MLLDRFALLGRIVGAGACLQLGASLAVALGSALLAALVLGLVFVMFPKVEHAMDPYLTVLNAMPRLALAPLFILWFGLGVGSKIAVGFSLTFFIVLSSTVAGIRGVNQDHITLSRTLGAQFGAERHGQRRNARCQPIDPHACLPERPGHQRCGRRSCQSRPAPPPRRSGRRARVRRSRSVRRQASIFA